MATNKRTIYLGLDYSNFTGGVTEVNRKMSLLDAEFKRATEEAKNYGTETDQLALKGDYLTQKIALQSQKVEEAKKAYEAAATSQNASQKEIDELNKRLINESTKLEQLNGQLAKTEKQTSGLNEANEKLNDTLKGLAVGIGATLTALSKFAVDTAETADDLKTLSSQTGLTTTEIQRLQYAANFIDVEFDTMSGAIARMEQNMNKARNGSNEMTEAFRRLHVRTTDNNGNFKDANEIFYELIDALGNVKNETELDTLAMTIFGRSAKELKPLIEQGSQALRDYGDEAERHSLIMSEDEVNAAANFKDSLDRLNAALNRIKQILGEALMPILEGIANFLTEVDLKTVLIIGAVSGIIALAYKLVTAISLVTTVMAAQTGIQTVFNATSLKTLGVILAIVAAIALLVFLISQLTGSTEEAEKGLQKMEQSTAKIGENIKGAAYTTNTVGRNATGTDFFSGGRTWVGEAGPELVTLPGAQENVMRTQSHATGTDFFSGGRTWVGEAGPELVTLPRGSRITPEKDVPGNVTKIFNITIDAKNVRDFNRVVELAEAQQMATRRV